MVIGWWAYNGFSCHPLLTSGKVREKVQTGMSYEEVRSALGNPDKTQEMKGSNDIAGTQFKTDMEFWYYGNTQICFDNGRVTTINNY